MLPDSLEDLEENELVTREVISEKPFRVQYSLTEYGQSLDSVIHAMRDWGQGYLAAPEGDPE